MPAVVFVTLEQSSNDDVGVGVLPVFRNDGGDSLALCCTSRYAFRKCERETCTTPQPLTPAEERIRIEARHRNHPSTYHKLPDNPQHLIENDAEKKHFNTAGRGYHNVSRLVIQLADFVNVTILDDSEPKRLWLHARSGACGPDRPSFRVEAANRRASSLPLEHAGL